MSNDTHTLKVPIDFGDIVYDDTNYFYPYKALAYDGNTASLDVGNYESFSKALLALISVNTIGKKNRSRSLTSPEMASEIDYLYYKTLETTNQHNTLSPSKNQPISNHQGPLRIVLGASEKQHQKSDNRGYTSPRYDPDNDPYYQQIVANINNNTNKIQQPIQPQMPNTYGTFQGGANPYIDYNNPLMNLTFKEVYERWYHDKSFEDISQHTMDNYRNTYNKVRHLDNIPFVQIRYSQIDECVRLEKAKGNSFSMRKRVKLFFSQLYQWAIAHEMCTNNIALNIKLGKNESDFRRKPFSIEQIQYLFAHTDIDNFVEEVLMLILCGCRIREFLNIRREDIHMDQRYFIVTQSKTKVGRGRIVPIHKKVMKFYRKHLRARSDYLIHDARGRQMEYEVWAKKFKNLMKYLEWEGMSIHGCRHTCATLLHTFGANIIDEKLILGHTLQDVHERIYLHAQLKTLIEAIDCIKI